MDTLTQVALGAAIAEAGFRERLGGKAVVLGACCGLIPDLDILSRLGGEWLFLIQHRSLSHSLFFLVLLTPFIRLDRLLVVAATLQLLALVPFVLLGPDYPPTS